MLSRWIAFAALAAFASAAAAQDYPRKPVRVIAPFAPGGSTDLLARLLSQKLTERWGQSAVVDYRVGAGGHIGAELAARAAPDGYTVVIAGSPHAIGMSLYKKPGYDLARDLAPIGNLVTYPSAIVVHPSLPVKNVKELIALARSKPGQLNFGSAGSGSPNHLAIELLKIMGKVDMVHVPYKGGSGQMVGDLLAGQVQLASIGLPPSMPYIKTGRLRVIAVTSSKRAALLPDAPTVSEAGLPGFDVTSWYGLFGPAALTKDLIAKVNADLAVVLASPDMKDRLVASGADPAPSTPEDLAKLVRVEVAKWAKVVADSGAKVD